jgi:16S rRNA (cytidine1402-2'-O)-methyltransferase
MLYLVATPIGNLADFSPRAVSTLQMVDYILCEDTRHSLTLLRHYQINKALKSYHRFNEAARLEEILRDMREGKTIALISDAGTPGIADPGQKLVIACREAGITVVGIPGACAAILALSCSGLPTDLFQFCGFLPRKAQELENALVALLEYPGTTVCYEAPHRLVETLEVLQRLAPQRTLVIARELTKRFEEFCRGTAAELLKRWEKEPPLGEIVLLVSGKPASENNWETLSPVEHVDYLEKAYHLARAEAIKLAAQLRGCPKREIYQQLHRDP